MPEGDSLLRAARALRPLVGRRIEAEAPHPRGRATGVAERVDGRVLEAVEAHGKNLLLRFEGGCTVRSHLGMTGSWRVGPRGAAAGLPWLVLRGGELEAVLRGGSRLELTGRAVARLGPDVLAPELELERIRAGLAADPRTPIGEALLDQRLVAGIGNSWRAESLWHARVSPWEPVGRVAPERLDEIVGHARRLMLDSAAGRRPVHAVYRRAGRPCPRCGTPVAARGQGDDNRSVYWCPGCQEGAGPTGRGGAGAAVA